MSFKLIIESFLCKRDIKKLEKRILSTKDDNEKAHIIELIELRKVLLHKDFNRFTDK